MGVASCSGREIGLGNYSLAPVRDGKGVRPRMARPIKYIQPSQTMQHSEDRPPNKRVPDRAGDTYYHATHTTTRSFIGED